MGVLGKSEQEQAQEQADKNYERSLHQNNLQMGSRDDDSAESAEMLRLLSEIDDLPIDSDDEVLGQLVSRLTSTANLSEEQVISNEWVHELINLLDLSQRPHNDGLHGAWRGWAHADGSEHLEPIDAGERVKREAFIGNSKIALTRSEGAKVIEESGRTVQESVVNDGTSSESSGGILGKLRS